MYSLLHICTILTQYAYETSTLCEIIISARARVLHPDLVNLDSTELEIQLTIIEFNLLVLNLNLLMTYTTCKNTRLKQNNHVLYRSRILFIATLSITDVELVLHIIMLGRYVKINTSKLQIKNVIMKSEFNCTAIIKN